MANEIVRLQRGKKATMPSSKVAGTILIATDTGEAYVDDTSSSRIQIKDTTKVDKTGDTMSGALNLGGNKITNLDTPTADADAATKKYVDDAKSAAIKEAGSAVSDAAVDVDVDTAALSVTKTTQASGPKNKYTISHKELLNSGTAGVTYGPTANLTPNYGESFAVPKISVDAKGHVTAVGSQTVQLPGAQSIPNKGSVPVLVTGTAAATAAKAVTNNYTALSTNDFFLLQFANGNTSSTMSLTIGGVSYSVTASGNVPLANIAAGNIGLFKITAAAAVTFYGLVNESYSAGTGISVSGTTISLASTGQSAATAGPSADASIDFGGDISIPYISTDAYGRSKIENRKITLPAKPSSVEYKAGTGLKLSNGTFSHDAQYTEASAGPSADMSPSFGGTFTVPQLTRDAQGHVTSISARTITLPKKPDNTTYSAGVGLTLNGTEFRHAANEAVNVGPVNDTTLNYGDSFEVPNVVSDNYGHVSTDSETHSITLPEPKLESAVADGLVQFRNTVIVANGIDPSTVDCPVGTLIFVKEE